MKALIIDDEVNCCKTMQMMLQSFTDVQVVGIGRDGVEGLQMIQSEKPDVVFLDIEMPRMNGFEMLEQLDKIDFRLVFTTSYDQYALKAFRYSAIDYLLKPIDKSELARAMEKVQKSNKTIPAQIEMLLQRVQHSASINKIAVPTMEGLQMILIEDIIYGEADDNYTILHLRQKRKVVVSTTLKDIEETLTEFPFARVHRCFLVNLNAIEKYVKGDGGYLIMSDGSSIDVSRTRKESLLRRLLPNKE